MVEERTDLHPDRPAISFRGRSLTYRQLDELANGLATTLAARGARYGDVVPVLLADGLELPVAYLALMKLGAAFVPLDPAWPAHRLRAVAQVIEPRLVLGATAEPLPGNGSAHVVTVALDDIVSTARRPQVPLQPDDLIYGIFTSGTTGTPKCAMNHHAGLTNRFRFMTRYFGATGDEVVLQNSRHTFDSSVWQMFWPLTTGGRVVVPSSGEFLNLEYVLDTVAAEGVTVTDFVPSIFNVLVAMVDRDPVARSKLASLRALVVGGEEINPAMVHRLRELLPDVRVTNGYGPTEASIGMIFHPVSPEDGEVVPIGHPIDNCYAAVLDPAMRPLPPGATGEIVIGGVCLGAGYLAAPARTAEAFVPNPLPEIPGSRLYRTGDLGYLGTDGRLYFVGRRDFQVKINGIRVELGEIEAAAARCPGVRQAKALVARQGRLRSLAVVAAAEEGLTEQALREQLARLLPRTSLPRHILLLPQLPLTDNGKVDRRRLQQLVDHKLAEAAVRLAEAAEPQTLLDRVLAVFQDVLGQPELTRDSHFLAAGGDSLQAVSATMALTEVSGVSVGVQDLFDWPTPAGMARFLAERSGGLEPAETEDDLVERDSRLPATLTIHAADSRVTLRTILVTGATGFVGSRLVHELLTATDLWVCCLARAAGDADATDRVIRALTERGLWQPRFADRLTAFRADLGRPDLGLDRPTWDHLSRTCDAILHNGALVNFLFDYRAHRPANVHGTAELLRLAMAHQPKPLHYISTLGTLDTEAALQPHPLGEEYASDMAVPPHSGYSRSKWVAERYLGTARRRGALVTILRLGEVMPAADNGHPNERALTHLLLVACQRLGIRPAAAIGTDYSPVDYVARRAVAAVVDKHVWGRTVHIFHPRSTIFTDLPSKVGGPLPRVTCTQFVTSLRAAASDTADRRLAALLSLLPQQRTAGEEDLRMAFEGLLVDNPRLFRRDECHRLEQRWNLTGDQPLQTSIAAYQAWLREHETADGSPRLLLPAAPL
ncbi:amino acid adenylation domain-containing protein [Phytohabitans rumicis]|uniref:Carrier domain-containing protein n=2 Tax=Phytohabitans rumicis TaxID=1076125 RepID=A0A6V8LFB9_9ACTN|nr:amino acid adenylation domain-containing protein [Phytohabitans rumicis]GFJ93531.1 hypothetical protein Prum_071730 [Phytohabitans rumicis]